MPDTRPRRRAIFLDRDGTINEQIEFVHRLEDLHVLSGAITGLQRMSSLGFLLIITTNQSGVGRGIFSEDDLRVFNDALCQQLSAQGIEIAAIYFCPYHPTDAIGAYRRDSPLRKPHPGMILQAAAEHDIDLAGSFAIGDKKSDILAGQAAGCRTILVRTGFGGGDEPALAAQPDFVADDLAEAAWFIEQSLATPEQ